MKVKVFSTKGKQFGFGDTLSRVTSQFEQDINHWLENNPKINITNIKQSSLGALLEVPKLLISVWYEED